MQNKKETQINPEVNLRPEEFEKYLDTQPFVIYAVAAILILIASLTVSMKLYLYGLIPLTLSNFVGVYGDEKNILLAMNVSYFLVFIFFKDSLNLLR